MTDRTLSSCSHKMLGLGCKKCGIYDHPADPPVKTTLYDSYLNCSAKKYLTHMRKRQTTIIENKEITAQTFALLETICEKFEYTVQTLALGIYVYARSCQKQDKDEKFWASAALIVASKGIELDKHVPYLNRYQRYADKAFTQEDYELAQKTIFQELDFDLQYTTFVSFLHFYLTAGVLFKSDAINNSILKYIQDDMLTRAKDYIKTGEFLGHDPEKLALSIVKEIRAKFRLEPWKKQIEQLSGYADGDIHIVQKSSILKPLNGNFYPKRDPNNRLHNISLNTPIPLTNLQSSLSLTDEKLKQSKKKLQSTLKFHNISTTLHTNPQPSLHNHSHNHNLNLTLNHPHNLNHNHNTSIKQNTSNKQTAVPLATLRNQVISSSHKYGNVYGTGNSNDRVITLSSFVTRRF